MNTPKTCNSTTSHVLQALSGSQTALAGAPTRREVLLLGLVILGIIWITLGQQPRVVVTIPDNVRTLGIIT